MDLLIFNNLFITYIHYELSKKVFEI
uniref:Uncharacterized protein n=1 Tax=Moumouvirus sp. 'Monve' TaxID=1128131 RepID=H2EF44_9VIRU|nr:hypothetical protein mv_L907 [Moumouvirus Monve]